MVVMVAQAVSAMPEMAVTALRKVEAVEAVGPR
jgi:hypothetical protein